MDVLPQMDDQVFEGHSLLPFIGSTLSLQTPIEMPQAPQNNVNSAKRTAAANTC